MSFIVDLLKKLSESVFFFKDLVGKNQFEDAILFYNKSIESSFTRLDIFLISYLQALERLRFEDILKGVNPLICAVLIYFLSISFFPEAMPKKYQIAPIGIFCCFIFLSANFYDSISKDYLIFLSVTGLNSGSTIAYYLDLLEFPVIVFSTVAYKTISTAYFFMKILLGLLGVAAIKVYILPENTEHTNLEIVIFLMVAVSFLILIYYIVGILEFLFISFTLSIIGPLGLFFHLAISKQLRADILKFIKALLSFNSTDLKEYPDYALYLIAIMGLSFYTRISIRVPNNKKISQ